MLKVLPKETHSILTRDRVRLDADVYRPDATGTFPVLLMRQPYGRAIASTVVYAHPIWYAAQGYIVVIQDVRGRGTSEGEFKLFQHEIEDGYDTIEWAAHLPGSSGLVGMYGFSYQGMTQLYAAIAQHPALKTICPAMIGYDLYSDWAYENGAFCLQANLSWALQLAAETARRRSDVEAHRMLTIAAKTVSFSDPIPTRSDILQTFDPDSFYFDWLQHAEPDEYWQTLSPATSMSDVDLPMLHIGGWFDTFLRGTLHLYKAMAAKSAFPQHLIIGPWAHLPWGRTVGTIDFSSTAISPCDRLQVRWFDHFLKGKQPDLFDQPPIQVFVMGINDWQYFPAWKHQSQISLSLSSTGRAAIDEQDGKLLFHAASPSPDFIPPDVIVHDPWRPVPALGGHAHAPAGVQERSRVDSRSDVLTYTSAPFTEPLLIFGEIFLDLMCWSDAASFDVCAVLSSVHPDGRVYNFCQGYIHLQPGQSTTPLTIALQPTCILLPTRYSLRLSLSAACFPAYPVNPGTGQLVSEARLIDQQIITIMVDPIASKLRLPVVDKSS